MPNEDKNPWYDRIKTCAACGSPLTDELLKDIEFYWGEKGEIVVKYYSTCTDCGEITSCTDIYIRNEKGKPYCLHPEPN